jgi:hypothetical protein
VLAQLLSSAARMLPRAQRALCVLPDKDAPVLQLAAEASIGPDGTDPRSVALPIVTGMDLF